MSVKIIFVEKINQSKKSLFQSFLETFKLNKKAQITHVTSYSILKNYLVYQIHTHLKTKKNLIIITQ